MPAQDISQDHPQRALAQLLVGCLNQAGQPHDVVLGTLLSVYTDIALKSPCCLRESARMTSEALAMINRAVRGTEAAPAAAVPMDATFPAAATTSAETTLATDLLAWLTARAEPTHVHMNVLICLYRHLALQLPAQTEAAALATSVLSGELLSRAARIAQAAHDAAATTTH